MTSRVFLFATLAGLSLLEPRAADASSEIRTAISALGAQPNYSWISMTKSEANSSIARQGPTEGKSDRDGNVYFRFILEGNPVEVAFHGPKCAIKTETAWESSEELTGDRQWIARRMLAFKPPLAEIEELLKMTKTMKGGRAGLFEGDLTPQGVKELLLARSRNELQTRVSPGTKGSLKLWIKNGLLAKYEYSFQGKIILTDHRQEFAVSRATTVEIKDVGSTRIQLPEEARKKLQ